MIAWPTFLNESMAGRQRHAVPAFELAGRVLIAALFLIAATRKAIAWDATLIGFGKLGLPLPSVVLPCVLLIEVVGSVLLVIGWRPRLVALTLALFSLSAALLGHQFWNVDPAQVNNQINHFLKVLGVVGGLLCVAASAVPKQSSQVSDSRG